jgi:hypothetical protein
MFAEKALPPKGFNIHQLLFLCGGKAAVAKACGVTNPRWTTVPDKHVATIAKLAGLPIAIIRPDLAEVAELYLARES